ncbi:MAG: tRNA (adenosine(37)-N6)-threonylcarbamoyltransferase complex ATPase subunit type 1 TsaE [Minisyncoccia bacterium]
MIYDSKSEKETGEIARKLAEQIVSREIVALRQAQDKAIVIALEGELGAGKTTFIKAFAKALGVKEKLTSPTFVIMRKFIVHDLRFKNLYHVDAYRLNSGEELKPLGIEEIIADPENIIMIEWAERVRDILPKKHISVHIDHIAENKRKIQIIL